MINEFLEMKFPDIDFIKIEDRVNSYRCIDSNNDSFYVRFFYNYKIAEISFFEDFASVFERCDFKTVSV